MDQLHETSVHHFFPKHHIGQQRNLIAVERRHCGVIQTSAYALHDAVMYEHKESIHTLRGSSDNILFVDCNLHVI